MNIAVRTVRPLGQLSGERWNENFLGWLPQFVEFFFLKIALQFAILIGLNGLTASSVYTQEWPCWRGPDRNDRSREVGLLKKWPEGGPSRIWLKENCGQGFAGIAISDNRLFTMGLENDREFAICLDANNGQEIWRVPFGETFREQHGDGPRGTPTIDGDNVYCLSSVGEIVCLSVADGKSIWRKNLRDFGGAIPKWGYSESLLVDEDRVVCTPGGEQGTVLALNKTTGEKVWQSSCVTIEVDGKESPPADAHYSSILPIEWNQRKQYIQLTPLAVVGFNATNGDQLWKSRWPGRIAVIPSPIFDNGQVYVTSGYSSGSKLIELTDSSTPAELWSSRDLSNHHGGVVLVDDCFFGSSEKAFVCQDRRTGKAKWANRKIGKGALIEADGLFYHVQESDGKVLLFSADENGAKLKGSFVLNPQSEQRKQGMIWVHPVICGGKLYLRDQEFLFCFDIKSKD